MKQISVSELKRMMDANEEFQLIDVREEFERDICTLDGVHIPMGEALDHLDKIRKDIPVVVHCRSGKRSATVINLLETQGYNNLVNLEGGILAWAQEIDPDMDAY